MASPSAAKTTVRVSTAFNEAPEDLDEVGEGLAGLESDMMAGAVTLADVGAGGGEGAEG